MFMSDDIFELLFASSLSFSASPFLRIISVFGNRVVYRIPVGLCFARVECHRISSRVFGIIVFVSIR